MARRLRLQYPGAIYHVMARGNGRQDIVCDDVDRGRLQDELGKAAIRCRWQIYAFAIMSNHLHIVLKTPEPNLSRGMQTFLSGYANVWSRRHKFCGHVFQGRYRTELVEDGTYLWPVTRYVHLNPVRAGLVEHPAAWAWSSYPGYAHRGRRLEWVAYDELLASSTGEVGGSDPAGAYRRYVMAGVLEPPESPWKEAYHGWVLGSTAFIDRLRAMVRGEPRPRAPTRSAAVAQCAAFENHRGRLFVLSDRARGAWRAWQPSSRASGSRLSREKTHDGHQRSARRGAGVVASGKCAEPDPAIR